MAISIGPSGRVGKADQPLLDPPGARTHHVVVLGPAEPLGFAVGIVPDPDGLLELAVGPAVGVDAVVLVEDVEDRVVVELDGCVVPEPLHLPGGPDAGRLLLTHRSHAPAAVADPPPGVRGDIEGASARLDRARPASGLGQAHRVEVHPTVAPQVLAGLLERRDRPVPREVEAHTELVLVEDDAQLVKGTNHLDAERTDAGVHPVPQLTRGPNHPVIAARHHDRERVLHRQVRVLAQTEDQQRFAVVGMAVEVVAVVEVAVARRGVTNRLGGLVDREVVP